MAGHAPAVTSPAVDMRRVGAGGPRHIEGLWHHAVTAATGLTCGTFAGVVPTGVTKRVLWSRDAIRVHQRPLSAELLRQVEHTPWKQVEDAFVGGDGATAPPTCAPLVLVGTRTDQFL